MPPVELATILPRVAGKHNSTLKRDRYANAGKREAAKPLEGPAAALQKLEVMTLNMVQGSWLCYPSGALRKRSRTYLAR